MSSKAEQQKADREKADTQAKKDRQVADNRRVKDPKARYLNRDRKS